MSRVSFVVSIVLFVALVVVTARADEYIPPARRRVQVPVSPGPTPTPTPVPDLDASAPLDGPYVPPGRRPGGVIQRPAGEAPAGPSLATVSETVRILSFIQIGLWTGGRYRGKDTGGADGGASISAKIRGELKAVGLLSKDGGIGAALGYSRAFGGVELVKGRLYAVAGSTFLTW